MMCPWCGDENQRTHPCVRQSFHAGLTTRIIWRLCPHCKKTYTITMKADAVEFPGHSKQVDLFNGEDDADN